MKFYIVDVFAETPLSGNQLAVCFAQKDLSSDRMQAIAHETNFSETTFVTGGDYKNGFDVRIFTPTTELPFAGHPTLGTAAVLNQIDENTRDEITLRLKVGDVKVTIDRSSDSPVYWLDGPEVSFGKTGSVEDLSLITGVPQDQFDTKYPIQQVSMGPTFTLIPFRSLASLDAMRLDLNAYQQRAQQSGLVEVYGLSREARDAHHDLSVRLLFDAGGVREDPATGSAAVGLGAWLLQHNYLQKQSFSIKVEQGGLINRPSTLYIQATDQHDTRKILVGGRVQFVASGNFNADI